VMAEKTPRMDAVCRSTNASVKIEFRSDSSSLPWMIVPMRGSSCCSRKSDGSVNLLQSSPSETLPDSISRSLISTETVSMYELSSSSPWMRWRSASCLTSVSTAFST